MKKLPIGEDTFSKLIEDDQLYIDKTQIALDLINRGSYYFLSRPRRFGKSLFLSTLKEIFIGNQYLFKGLHIYDKWNFTTKYPVIRINFGTGFIGEISQFDDYLKWVLQEVEKDLEIACHHPDQDAKGFFRALIWKAEEKYQQKVVILIDEYDKPILDNITDKVKARAIRDKMKEFYAIIKSNGAYLRFVFITGVSKFSKMSLFSGLNNLEDITLDNKFGNICGFLGDKVYNPFDILLFISQGFEFRNYWWKTGNPSFLIDLINEKDYAIPQVANYKATEEILDSFDVDTISLEVLLWQTGYLTITKKITERNRIKYQLGIPNLEIQHSLNDFFIDTLTTQKFEKLNFQDQLYELLASANLEQLKQTFIQLFASIPYHNFTNNKLANYEGYYASVLYAYLASLGHPIIPEDVTNKGRIDLTLQLPDITYIFEFKVVEKATQQALQQIKTKQYYQKYNHQHPIYLIGIEFGKAERNIVHWEVEQKGIQS